jgi:hypothetical protein
MQLRDVVGLLISTVALLLSGVATTVSILRGKKEGERTIRNQLSEVLSKINSTNVENAKISMSLAHRIQKPSRLFRVRSINSRHSF